MKNLALELQAGFIANVIDFQLRINQIMSSRVHPGLVSNLINFQWRLNQIMSFRAPEWIHMRFDKLSIKNQSSDEL